MASHQQQQVISSFTASSTKRHLVLEGPAGTGKTLVAIQVANNLLESATDFCEEEGNQPLLQSLQPTQNFCIYSEFLSFFRFI